MSAVTPQPIVEQDRLPPVRGLVCAHNARGQAFALETLEKWLRLNAETYQCAKADVAAGAGGAALLRGLLERARPLDLALSWRCDGIGTPPDFAPLAAGGLLDCFVVPPRWDAPDWPRWTAAARAAGLGVRLQLTGPFHGLDGIEELAARCAGACMVNVAACDPFVVAAPCRGRDGSARSVAAANRLARTLAARGIEVNLLHFPFAWIDEANLGCAAMWPQFFLDHQQYRRRAYETAQTVVRLRPAWADKAIENLLGQQTSFHNRIDDLVLPWILHHPAAYIRLWAWHKLTRHLRWLRRGPRPLPEGVSADAAGAAALLDGAQADAPPRAADDRFRRIADHRLDAVRHCYPGLDVPGVPGEAIVDPMHFLRAQPKHYDAIDAARLEALRAPHALAQQAARIASETPPTREIRAEHYAIEGHDTQHMPGAVRWPSFSTAELRSTVLARLEPPFTIGLTFGGGIASHIGFSFGRHATIVCPMTAFSHRLMLHVAADGHYALLRDGEPVRPAEFEGMHLVPRRLGGVLEPRISIWNIDGQILTQTLLLWQGAPAAPAAKPRYSVLIVSTCYARRLQAVLLGIARQRGIDLAEIEVVVAYVPGIDATDDLLDSLRLAYPALRIVRSPFPRRFMRSKGFMINESLASASGEWIVLLDSDIVLPPDTFAAIARDAGDAAFVALDGRVMLPPETTARILLGEIAPWDAYEALAASDAEYRARESDGIPIGFFQCVRRDVFDRIRYAELDHFEGSDWLFGKQVVEEYGPERRLHGLRALHLDHGGSQWYGASKHM